MPRKLHDELKSLTSGIATTGLEYVKHRKKKQLRGGIVPLIVMGLQTGIMELANWALEQDAKKEREEAERIERHNQAVWEREAKRDQDNANSQYARELTEETGNIQRQYANEYKNQLRSALEQQRREEQAYYEQEDLMRKSANSQLAERQRRQFEGDLDRQNLSAVQRRLAIQQEDLARRRELDEMRINQGRQQFDALNRASQQKFDAELRQRLRNAQAEAQAQALTQQRRPVRAVGRKSTSIKKVLI